MTPDYIDLYNSILSAIKKSNPMIDPNTCALVAAQIQNNMILGNTLGFQSKSITEYLKDILLKK
jgi:hypothetical protein